MLNNTVTFSAAPGSLVSDIASQKTYRTLRTCTGSLSSLTAGVDYETFAYTLLNDTWLTAIDAAGNPVNLLKISKDNLLEFAPKVGLNAFYFVQNPGFNYFADIPVSSEGAGVWHGTGIRVGGIDILKTNIYGLADSARIEVPVIKMTDGAGYRKIPISRNSLGLLKYSTGAYLDTLLAYRFLIPTSTNTLGQMSAGTTGKLIRGVTGSMPVWTTPTFPNTADSGKVLIGDKTNITLSNARFPLEYPTYGNIMRSNGTDWRQVAIGLGLTEYGTIGTLAVDTASASILSRQRAVKEYQAKGNYLTTAVTSLGGLTGATQTFAIGTTGTAPAWSSATTTHTLNIPMAATTSVAAGLISKTQYDSFAAKASLDSIPFQHTPSNITKFRGSLADALVLKGTTGGSLAIAEGAGTRLQWNPTDGSFRAGTVEGTEWDKSAPYKVGTYSFAVNHNTTASYEASGALGEGTLAGEFAAFATGDSTRATGMYSSTFGIHTNANSMYNAAFGKFNVGGGTSDADIETDPLFEIGNGTDNTHRNNAFGILKNGYSTFSDTVKAKAFVKTSGTATQFLMANGTVRDTVYQTKLTNPVTGTGVSGYLPHFSGVSTIDSSGVYWDGTRLAINTTTPHSSFSLGSNTLSQQFLSYDVGNIRSGMGRYFVFGSGLGTKYFVPTGYIHSFGHMSTTDGTTYTENMRITSGGNLQVTDTVKANGFIKTGGTATQFMMANGAVRDTVYQIHVPAGSTSQYWRGDKTWQTLPTYTLSGLGGVALADSTASDGYTRRDRLTTELFKKRSLNNHDSLSTLDEKSYNSLTDKPNLALYRLNNDHDSLNTLQEKNYSSLDGKPDLTVYRMLNNHDSLSVLDEKSYNSLTDKPTLSIYRLNNDHDSLSTLQEKNYSSLDGKPDLTVYKEKTDSTAADGFTRRDRLTTELFLKVTKNANITGATKTKITYDVKGLITSGADATTYDISPTANRYYITPADTIQLDNLTSNLAGKVALADSVGGGTGKYATGKALANHTALNSTTSTNGHLSSTDWNTFNGKQAALSGTGFVKASGTTISYDNATYLTSESDPTVNNATLTLAVSGSGLSGSQTFTANQASGATFTVTSNATTSNAASTPGTIVLRATDGTVALVGTFCSGSDSTLKRNIRPFSKADLYNASKIDFVKFLYKSDATNQLHLGVIAQQVEKFIPEVVHTNENGKLEVNYPELLVILAAQHAEEIKLLKEQNRQLERRISKLEDHNKWEAKQINF